MKPYFSPAQHQLYDESVAAEPELHVEAGEEDEEEEHSAEALEAAEHDQDEDDEEELEV